MAKLFKDFDKETKDLLTKDIAEGKAEKGTDQGWGELIWKAESKYKVDKSKCCDVIVNPVFETTGKKECVFNVECGLKDFNATLKNTIKLNAAGAPDLWATVPKATWEQDTHKVEVALESGIENYKEMAITVEEKTSDFATQIAVNHTGLAKSKQKATVDIGAPLPGVDGVAAGCKVEIPYATGFNFNAVAWSAGLRFTQSKACTAFIAASGTGKKLAGASVGALFTIPGFKLEGKDVDGAASFDFGFADNSYKLQVGASGRVPGDCTCNGSWKIKVAHGNKLTGSFATYLSYIVPVKGWKVGTTCNPINRTFGISATCE